MYLKQQNIDALMFFLGVPKIEPDDTNRVQKSDLFRVGGFGFMRKHKGIFKCIKAVGKINQKKIEYCGFHALLDTDESQKLLQKCVEYIKDNNLEERIKIDTAFLPILDVIRGLSSCDIIVLPYDESNEGLSASASLAFSIGIPVCVTDAHIFDAIKPYAYIIENNDESTIQKAIKKLMDDKIAYQKYCDLAAQYNKRFSIGKTAENYINLRK